MTHEPQGSRGFVVGSGEKITYNHSDSYPDYLGANVLAWLRGTNLDDARQAAARRRVVDQPGPTHE